MWTFIKEFFGIGLNDHVEEQKKSTEQPAVIKQVEVAQTETTKTKKPKAQPKPKAPKKNAKK